MSESEQSGGEEPGLVELKQKLSDEIIQTDILIRRIKDTVPSKEIEEQTTLILEKLQSLQKKIDQALPS